MQFFKLAAVALFFMMQFNVERAVSQEVDGVGDQEEVSRDEVDEGEDYGVIFLFGSINDKSINFLMQTINNMQKRDEDRIWLIINSGGGTVESALSFYNMVQSFDVKLDTYNVGQASSAAAMMFLSGERRVMAPNSYFMIHDITTNAGTVDEYGLKNKLELMNSLQNAYTRIYSKETGITLERVRKLMRDVTYLDEKSCMEMNFCTEVSYAELPKESFYASVSEDGATYVFPIR